MSKMDYQMDVAAIRAKYESGELTSAGLVRSLIERVDLRDGEIRAFLSFDRKEILAAAEAADERRKGGRSRGPLDGIPVAIKDNLAVRGQPLTCASKMLASYRCPYDAHVTERLREAGAILFGRCNLDEFAMGSSTENSAVGATRNPWDPSRVPGGSSGGSAAAVAAGFVPLSIGSDTGGSIRQPAALCGVVGMKPTYGLVSRFGLVAFASSLDQIGPFARTVADAAALLDVIAGPDRRDSTSLRRDPPRFSEGLSGTKLRGLKIGVPDEYFGDGLASDVRAAVDRSIDFYRSEGAEIIRIHLPNTDLCVPVYYILATAEASSNLARYDGIRYGHRAEAAADGIDLYYRSRGEGFGPEVKRRILLGTYVLSSGYYDAYYLRAQKVRRLIRRDFDDAFETVDLIATPTAPTTAFEFGAKSADPLSMYLSDIFTISANLAGIPALSLPCGYGDDGMPIGLQLMGPDFSEPLLLGVAEAFERAHDFGGRVAGGGADETGGQA